jgi:hypothetical protein
MVPAAPIAGLRLEQPRELGELRARVAAYAGRNGIRAQMRAATSVSSSMTRSSPAPSARVTPIDGHFLDFRDPWGNRIKIVGYDNIQFTKAPHVLRGIGLTHLSKNESAKRQLAKKSMSLEQLGYPSKFD